VKIVSKKEFLKLPPGTIYSKYQPINFGDIEIKGETISDFDYYYTYIAGNIDAEDFGELFDKMDELKKSDIDIPIDLEIENRDGLFEDDQLYAIYSKEDIKSIIKKLEAAL
jgi:hypothetical protein